ncbi:hypothetical protein [Dickeya zeae]|uniref:Uncharacterized protein n=1 Tax=Dickeya zeae TaxID=204042 RepID=A0ABX8VRM2_9GAMM|nr:hypothetical protein [Dickeya zeae]QYM90445.1 hypothetical protein FGI21_00435 [Dickeya zeae]
MYINGKKVGKVNSPRNKIKFGIQTWSLLITCILFVVNIAFGRYQSYVDQEQQRNNVRVLIAYDIVKNESVLKYLYGIRGDTKERDEDNESTELSPIHFNMRANTRINYLSQLQDDFYSKVYSDIKILPPDEVALILQYSKTLYEIKKITSIASAEITKNDTSDTEMKTIEMKINFHFIRLFEISGELSKKYSKITSVMKRYNDECEYPGCFDLPDAE